MRIFGMWLFVAMIILMTMPSLATEERSQWGYIDKDGNMVIEAQFAHAFLSQTVWL